LEIRLSETAATAFVRVQEILYGFKVRTAGLEFDSSALKSCQLDKSTEFEGVRQGERQQQFVSKGR
jgi:hypothetical protein